MNYDQLVETIKGYTENDFPDTAGSGGMTSTEQINTFIINAEERIFNMVQLLDLRKNVTGNVTAGNKYLSVPSDWLANFSLAVIDPVTGDYEFLLNKDVSYIRAAYPSPTDLGKPLYYAFFDVDSYILGPTPNANYEMELHYFYYPQSITEAGTSWLGDNFESVLLYGSLLEAYTFMKGEADVIAQYQKRYDEALGMLKQLGEGKNRQDMYRTQQVRYPVR
jgi:hypothetical protein